MTEDQKTLTVAQLRALVAAVADTGRGASYGGTGNWEVYTKPGESGEVNVTLRRNSDVTTILEASKRLGLAYNTVRDYVIRQAVPVIGYGPKGLKYIDFSDVKDLKRKSAAGRKRGPITSNRWLAKHQSETETPA